jgi:hypothetical protein
MKKVLSSLAFAAASLIAVSTAQAQQTADNQWRAVGTGSLESTPNDSPGYTIATFELSSSNMLMIDLPFKDLQGTTTAAHIHCCASTAFSGDAGIAVPFTDFTTGVHTGTYSAALDLTQDSTFDSAFLASNGGTAASARAAVMAGIDANEAYVNIHTDQHPNGEIRGWLVAAPIPEPATWAMLGVGLAGLGFMSRRRFS